MGRRTKAIRSASTLEASSEHTGASSSTDPAPPLQAVQLLPAENLPPEKKPRRTPFNDRAQPENKTNAVRWICEGRRAMDEHHLYIADVAKHIDTVRAQRSQPHLRKGICEILTRFKPYRLSEQPTEDQKLAFSVMLDQFETTRARAAACRVIQDLAKVVTIHEHILEVLQSEEQPSQMTKIREIVAGVMGTRSDKHDRGPRLWLTRTVISLQELGGSSDIEDAVKKLSFAQALYFCCESVAPPETFRARCEILMGFGFPEGTRLRKEMPHLEKLRDEVLKLGPASRSKGLSLPKPPFAYLVELSNVFKSSTPHIDCCTKTLEELANIMRGVVEDPKHSLYMPFLNLSTVFTTLTMYLKVGNREDLAKALPWKVPSELSPNIPAYEWAIGQCDWNAKTFPLILEGIRDQAIHTSFKDASEKRYRCYAGMLYNRVLKFLVTEPVLADGIQVPQEENPFQWFVDNVTTDILVAFARFDLSESRENSTTIHRSESGHNGVNRVYSTLVHGLRRVLREGQIDWTRFSTKNLKRLLPPREIEDDGATRRTLTESELNALMNIASKDARWNVVVIMLREIAPRCSALCHAKYYSLFDETHIPLHSCRILEKGKQYRHFITSTRLKTALRRYSEELRKRGFAPVAGSNTYLFNIVNPNRPLNSSVVNANLKRFAKLAGIVDVNVHPHMFRHTVVGNLVQAGNSIEVASRYLGHRTVDTTAKHYFVPTMAELHDMLINPWTGKNVSTDGVDVLKVRIERLEQQREALEHLLVHLFRVLSVGAQNSESAADVAARFLRDVPNAEEIIGALMATTSCTSYVAPLTEEEEEVASQGVPSSTDFDNTEDDIEEEDQLEIADPS